MIYRNKLILKCAPIISLQAVPVLSKDSEVSSVKVVTPGLKTTNVTKGFDLAQKEANRLNVTPRSQSPASGRGTPINIQPSSEQTGDDKNFKQKDNKTDVVTQYKKERGGSKEHLYMVVIGHVDAGKSTLMGHLLCSLGQVRILISNYNITMINIDKSSR